MQRKPAPLSPEFYLLQMFSARAARQGGVVRRKTRDIDRFVGRKLFLNEIERRGYSAIENAGQIVVFCNAEPVNSVAGNHKSLKRIWPRPLVRVW